MSRRSSPLEPYAGLSTTRCVSSMASSCGLARYSASSNADASACAVARPPYARALVRHRALGGSGRVGRDRRRRDDARSHSLEARGSSDAAKAWSCERGRRQWRDGSARARGERRLDRGARARTGREPAPREQHAARAPRAGAARRARAGVEAARGRLHRGGLGRRSRRWEWPCRGTRDECCARRRRRRCWRRRRRHERRRHAAQRVAGAGTLAGRPTRRA